MSEERLPPAEIRVHRGLLVTCPVRSLFHTMRHARTVQEAVTAADMAAYSDLVSRAEAVAVALANPGWTGIGRMRNALDEMEENAWSPAEVTMRHYWSELAGMPRPVCNRPVFDLEGRHVATPDLLDPTMGVVGEYDSTLHLVSAQRARDVRREGWLRSLGLEHVTMLAADLSRPEHFAARLRQAYARAARVPATDRRWSATPPPWWVPTFTVEQRRSLDESQRARYLKLRLKTG